VKRPRAGATAAVAAALILSGIGSELIARPVWDWQYRVVTGRILKSFHYIDSSDNVMRNKPGTWTYRQLHDELTRDGRHLGADDLERLAADYHLRPDDVVLAINRQGFLGPELRERAPGRRRLVAIGDSVTFGPYYLPMSYPRVMERAFAERGADVEVVNTAVQGYSLQKVLRRLDDFLALEPDVITVMIGWNQTLIRADPAKNEYLYRHSALYRFAYHLWSQTTSPTQYPGDPQNYYDPNEPFVARLRATTFEWDLRDWAELTSRIRARLPHCRIVVLGLAGLFQEGVEPDAAAMRMGYAVTFTPNLAAWEVLAGIYNRKLAEFARREGLQFVDVAAWSREAFVPRSSFFIDSVHPNSRGYDLMGRFIAGEVLRAGVAAEPAAP